MSVVAIDATLRAAYLQLLEQQFGLRIASHQASQVDEVVMQMLPTSSFTQPADLYAAMAAGLKPHLLEVLATSLTIGETHFFRVTPQIEALRQLILPDLIARHRADRRLRLWSAGCSTGEEPYTLAMLLCELLPSEEDWQLELVATDLNLAALEVARLAVYGEWSFRDSPSDVRTRYFTPMSNRWQLNDRIRRMVRFAQLNLADDPLPYFSEGKRIDLILCRNVTIYFAESATQRLYERFTEALELTGWLVLGPSDPVPAATSGLEMVAVSGAMLWRRKRTTDVKPVPPPRRSLPRRPIPATTRSTVAAGRAKKMQPVTAAPPSSTSMDPLVHLQAGMLRLGEGAPVAAIDCLRRASFLDETSALVQFSLGRAYRQIGDSSRSRAAFSRARRLLAGVDDGEPLAGGEGKVATGELRHAVDLQLADLDGAKP